jgi:hypothetical protein
MTMMTYRPEDFATAGDVADLYLGIKDATQEVSAAFQAINTGGRSARLLLEGKYRISSPLILPRVDGLAIEGVSTESGVIVDPAFPANSDVFLSDTTAPGRGVLTATTVSTAAVRNQLSVSVVSISGFQEGDIVQIERFQTSAVGSSLVRRFQSQVTSVKVKSKALVFDQPLPFSVSAGTVVRRLGCRRGLVVSKLGFWGAGTVEHTQLNLRYERDAVVEDILCVDAGLKAIQGAKGGGVIFNVGYGNFAQNLKAIRCGSGGEDAIAIKKSGRCKAIGLDVAQTRFGVGLSWSNDCIMTHIVVDQADTRGVKLAGAVRNQLDHLQINNTGHTSLAVSQFSSYNTISDVQMVYVPGTGSGTGVWTNGESSNSNQVLGIVGDAIAKYIVNNAKGDAGNVFEVVRNIGCGPAVVLDPLSRVVYL